MEGQSLKPWTAREVLPHLFCHPRHAHLRQVPGPKSPGVFDLIWGTGASWGLWVPSLGKSFLGVRGSSCLSGPLSAVNLAVGPCPSLCPPIAPLPLCRITESRTKNGTPGLFEREGDGERHRPGGAAGERKGQEGPREGPGTERRKRRVGLRHRQIADWLIGEIFGRCHPLLQGSSLLSSQGPPSISENKVPPAATSAVLGVSRKEKDPLAVSPPSFLCISAHRHWFPNPTLPPADSRASKGHVQVEMHVVPRAASASPSHR